MRSVNSIKMKNLRYKCSKKTPPKPTTQPMFFSNFYKVLPVDPWAPLPPCLSSHPSPQLWNPLNSSSQGNPQGLAFEGYIIDFSLPRLIKRTQPMALCSTAANLH